MRARNQRLSMAAVLIGCCLLSAAIINWMILSGALDKAAELDAAFILANPRAKGLTKIQPDAMHPSMRYLPKIVHMTVGSRKPAEFLDNLRSWQELNLGWEVRLYNDTAVNTYVKQRFPQYEPTFKALGNLVEKADMFRYLVLWGEGGVFTDASVECLRPLDEYMPSMGAGLVVGWERDGVPPSKCSEWQYARTRQLLHWTLASVSGHPVLERMAEYIVQYHNITMHSHPVRDTLERTGSAAFTDVVLRYMKEHPPAQTTGWPVTLLPSVVWGLTDDGNTASGWMKAIEYRPPGPMRTAVGAEGFGGCLGAPPGAMWPVTIPWSTPFHVMVHLPWEGSREASGNPSLRLSRYGTWQPGLKPTDNPSPLDVLSLLMRQVQEPSGEHGSLMDIGAGYGLHSLAMAAQGYRVVAFARPYERAYAAFERSMQYNGFGDVISLFPVQLAQTVLVEKPRSRKGHPTRYSRKHARRRRMLLAAADDEGVPQTGPGPAPTVREGISDAELDAINDNWVAHNASLRSCLHITTDGRIRADDLSCRRYLVREGTNERTGAFGAEPSSMQQARHVGTSVAEDERHTLRRLHQMAADGVFARDANTANSAWMLTQRTAMDSLHAALRSQYNLQPVSVVRVSANGWEPLLLDSVLGVLPQSPMAIMFMWDAVNMGHVSGGMEARDVMNRLLSLGYDRVLEAVKGCCSNTSNASQLSALVAQEAIALGPELATLSWCDISNTRFGKLLELPKDNLHKKPGLRNVVFLHRSHPLAAPASSTRALQQCYATSARRATVRDPRTRGVAAGLRDGQTGDNDGLEGSPAAELILPRYEQVQPKTAHEMGQLVKGVAGKAVAAKTR